MLVVLHNQRKNTKRGYPLTQLGHTVDSYQSPDREQATSSFPRPVCQRKRSKVWVWSTQVFIASCRDIHQVPSSQICLAWQVPQWSTLLLILLVFLLHQRCCWFLVLLLSDLRSHLPGPPISGNNPILSWPGHTGQMVMHSSKIKRQNHAELC